jgi:hypothetical protein
LHPGHPTAEAQSGQADGLGDRRPVLEEIQPVKLAGHSRPTALGVGQTQGAHGVVPPLGTRILLLGRNARSASTLREGKTSWNDQQ